MELVPGSGQVPAKLGKPLAIKQMQRVRDGILERLRQRWRPPKKSSAQLGTTLLRLRLLAIRHALAP